jgi:hypothetical protein
MGKMRFDPFTTLSLPMPILVRALAQDESFREDIGVVLELESAKFEALSVSMGEATPFLDPKSLSTVVTSALGPSPQTNTVLRVIRRLNAMFRDFAEPVSVCLQSLAEAVATEDREAFDSKKTEQLAIRLKALISEPQGLRQQNKAERLALATGLETKDTQVICDARPVFDEQRTKIDGIVTITTLRVDHLDPDGVQRRAEFRLTEQQLGDLCLKAESAKRKLQIIKNTLSDKAIPVALTPGMVDERKAP